MGEVGIEVGCVSNSSIRHDSMLKMMKSFDSSSSVQVLPITDIPTLESSLPSSPPLNPIEAWLPITESRNGNTFSAMFHLLCSGIGIQALSLPFAFASLGWVWGMISISVTFVWQLYTTSLLIKLHESPSRPRCSRYLLLAITAFGTKLGKLLSIFPVMYLSGGTCVMLIITGGGTMQLLFKTLCREAADCHAKSLSGAEWFLVFTSLAIAMAQLPNLNSIAKTSLVGAIMALGYCTLLWALSISMDRPKDISYEPLVKKESGVDMFGGILSAIGIIVLCFRGHNVVLEIQGTLPSDSKQPSRKTMWRAVKISYTLIVMCLFSLAIAGFWAYGDEILFNGTILTAILKIHGDKISKSMMILICIQIIISCLCTFQIYAMVVFDNLEFRYISSKKKKCPWWVRTCIRLFFGGLAFFIAVTFPFLGSLAPLIGGMTMPLTYVYPCFMWIAIKKPSSKSAMWWVNLALGCLGVILSVLLVAAAIWNLSDKGLNANFFDP
ncbi:lysine histidine transporter-like 7 [Ziziphus jujuba]|uniref:Lysine histidine transporter-like 7 n=1 Tax=Ziziphus jujuba TaxID=326968 RepID=A0A6P4AVI1_ZIZJJ|nr:lysine histidine transporter-like 7 [Ziziphus jujuba]